MPRFQSFGAHPVTSASSTSCQMRFCVFGCANLIIAYVIPLGPGADMSFRDCSITHLSSCVVGMLAGSFRWCKASFC